MRASRRPVLLTIALTGLAGAAIVPAAGASPGALTSASPPDAAGSPAVLVRAAAPSPVGIVDAPVPGGTIEARVDPRVPGPAGTLADGQNFVIRCQTEGETTAGPGDDSAIWDGVQLPSGALAYVPDALVRTSTKDNLVAPYCGAPAPTRVGGRQGACFLRSPVPLIRAPRTRPAFLRKAGPDARRSFRSTRVPASITLAQAILESGDGKATAGANNFFGIKAEALDPATATFAWGRYAIGCVHQPTIEYEDGRRVRHIAQFRLYRTMRASFVDHGAFLRDNPRYATAFRYSRSPRRFARALQRAGYATDPGYSAKLIALMREERLTRWD
jgi:hypothetical protein